MKLKSKILKSQSGMTLLEIMIVLVILGGLTGVLVTSITSQLKRSRISETKILIDEISKALDMYMTTCGSYPSTDQGLDALMEEPSSGCNDWGPDPYLKKLPKDAWQGELIYEKDGGSFVLLSLGADGREGGTKENKDLSSEDE